MSFLARLFIHYSPAIPSFKNYLLFFQKLASHDEEALASFISILDKLNTCLADEAKQQATDDRPAEVPLRSKLAPPLRRLGQRSVLYSPRTAFRRSTTRSTAIRQSVKDAVRRMRPTILEPDLQLSILHDSLPSNMANSVHQLQMRQIALNSRGMSLRFLKLFINYPLFCTESMSC